MTYLYDNSVQLNAYFRLVPEAKKKPEEIKLTEQQKIALLLERRRTKQLMESEQEHVHSSSLSLSLFLFHSCFSALINQITNPNICCCFVSVLFKVERMRRQFRDAERESQTQLLHHLLAHQHAEKRVKTDGLLFSRAMTIAEQSPGLPVTSTSPKKGAKHLE